MYLSSWVPVASANIYKCHCHCMYYITIYTTHIPQYHTVNRSKPLVSELFLTETSLGENWNRTSLVFPAELNKNIILLCKDMQCSNQLNQNSTLSYFALEMLVDNLVAVNVLINSTPRRSLKNKTKNKQINKQTYELTLNIVWL